MGQTTTSLEQRWSQHCKDTRRGRAYPILSAIKKYGPENFELSILAKPETLEEMNLGEEAHILARNSSAPSGYNLAPGGNNHQHHPETRAKMSAARKGKPCTPANRKHLLKYVALRTGKKLGPRRPAAQAAIRQANKKPERCAKVSAGLTGRTLSINARRRIGAAQLGKSKSAESNIKRSLALKGRPLSDTNKRNIGVAMTGKHPSEATRLKMRTSQQRRQRREQPTPPPTALGQEM